jgi:hypothetical protein
LRRSEIDIFKWDACISRADNGLIYGYSIYLDSMTTHWDAMVMGDYEAVMPLPWRRKYFVSYLYQPFAVAQLGVFGNAVSADMVTAFFRAVPGKFRYWDLPLNHQNLFAVTDYPLYQRANYVLPLNKSYEALNKGYRENIRRNIKKSREYGCTLVKEISIDAVLQLTRFQPVALHEDDLAAFKTLFHRLQQQGMAKTYGMQGKNGDLLASAVFFFSHNRAYYILVGNHPNGRTLGASHALIDGFIQDHASQNLLLDFEGSDVRNLAFFYSSFGAREENYAAIRLNRLPWWARWMK